MTIAITGLSGFVGSHLKRLLEQEGHQIIKIPHNELTENSLPVLKEKLQGCQAVINLAGAPIAGRWTQRRKKEILESRIRSTRVLVKAINGMEHKPGVLISASAIGYYSHTGVHDEHSKAAENDFLSQVCQQWESEAAAVSPDVRLVILRFGLVLGADGGMLPRVLRPARSGIILRFGNGHQPFSWIHVTDLVRIITQAVTDNRMSGIYNCVAPDTVAWIDLMYEIRMQHRCSLNVPIPTWLLRCVLLDGAVMLTHGQQVIPERLLALPFRYRYPELEEAVGVIYQELNSPEHR